jgi:hypothetical protein
MRHDSSPGCTAARAVSRALLYLLIALTTSVQAAAPEWADPSLSPRAQAEAAVEAGIDAGIATSEMLRQGLDAAGAVVAVADAYRSCAALEAAVGAAARDRPEKAAAVVNAVSGLARCPCSGDDLWAQTRFDQRIRIQQRREPALPIARACACIGVAAAAAGRAAPDRAAAIVAASVGSLRSANTAVDGIGSEGSERGPAALLAEGQGNVLVRRPERRCEREVVVGDRFETEVWQAAAADWSLPRRDARAQCDNDDARALIQAYGTGGGNSFAVIENPDDAPLDLALAGYQLEARYAGRRDAARRIALAGVVPARGVFVVAAAGADAQVRERADLVSELLAFGPNDALRLRSGLETDSCECARATYAALANALPPEADVESGSARARDPLTRMDGALTRDSIGALRPRDVTAESWRSPLPAARSALARARCEPDTNALDPFVPAAAGWAEAAAAARCSSHAPGPWIARLDLIEAADREPVRQLELFNPGQVALDLEREAIALRLYADGSRTPFATELLGGRIDPGSSLRIASARRAGDEETMQFGALGNARLDAIEIVRLDFGGAPMCARELAAAARELGDPPLVIAAAREPPLDGEPRTDESPIDPNRGGDVASPN